jgi:hypothetical protein
MFSYNYFDQIMNNKLFDMFYTLFDKFPQYYYMDFISTIVGRKAGCSLGNWIEVSETKPYYGIDGDKFHVVAPSINSTLVHDYKI